MAIYHLNVSSGSRKSGASASSKSRYIAREARYSDTVRYDALVSKSHGNLPEWANDSPAVYWDAADEYERANGRLYNEIEFSLPRELSPEDQEILANEFIATIHKGQLPYQMAIHAGKGSNPHCHFMYSERINDGVQRSPQEWFSQGRRATPKKDLKYKRRKPLKVGGALKDRSNKNPKWLENIRESWAVIANKAIERAGFDSKIDHRSHKDRGLEYGATKHVGVFTGSDHAKENIAFNAVIKKAIKVENIAFNSGVSVIHKAIKVANPSPVSSIFMSAAARSNEERDRVIAEVIETERLDQEERRIAAMKLEIERIKAERRIAAMKLEIERIKAERMVRESKLSDEEERELDAYVNADAYNSRDLYYPEYLDHDYEFDWADDDFEEALSGKEEQEMDAHINGDAMISGCYSLPDDRDPDPDPDYEPGIDDEEPSPGGGMSM